MNSPELIIFTGPMFGGKTTRMLSFLERAKHRKMKIVLFKPQDDTRYSATKVKTHTGASWSAITVESGADVLAGGADANIVAVDEAFMIPDSAQAILTLFKMGKTVYVSSIQLSAGAEAFEEMQQLFPWATRIEVCPAVCPVCGDDAYYTIAKVEDVDHIQVGGAETYEPRCYVHSNIPIEKKEE